MLLLLVLAFLLSHFLTKICVFWLGDGPTVPTWLLGLTQQLAQRLTIPTPRLYILQLSGLNAFALDNFAGHGHILLHAHVLKQLNQDEVQAIVAHELSHLVTHHSRVLSFVQAVTLPVTLPVSAILSLPLMLLGSQRGRAAFFMVHHLVALLLFPLTSLVVAVLTRHWEFEADKRAAELIGVQKYITVLHCLHGSFFQHANVLSGVKNRSSFWNISHPSLEQRIHALRSVGEPV